MSATLTLHRAGAGLSVQDMGRPGHMAQGLSRGGAADRLALREAAALLGLKTPVAGIEMALTGAEFSVGQPTRVALTGARMQASLNGTPVDWNATLLLSPGDRLNIGAVRAGTYGYLTPAGGIATPLVMGARSAHLAGGIGAPLAAGTTLPIGDDPAPATPAMILRPDDRLAGGELRVMPGPQSGLFDAATRDRFFATAFRRAPAGNRQGVRLDFDGAPFAGGTAGLASDIVRPGDIQMTGDGIPYVLLAECQTMGGYPRIGTVIPQDLPRIAQAMPGMPVRFRAITTQEADALWQPEAAVMKSLARQVQTRLRDPHDIPDLLSYQLIGGVVRGDETEA